MSANNINNNNQFVAFQDVNNEYSWVNYGQFKLLMMKRRFARPKGKWLRECY